MTSSLLGTFFFAALTAVSVAGLYLAWPRPVGPEEWIDRRRVAEGGGRRRPNVIMGAVLSSLPVLWLRRSVRLIHADLELLKLGGMRAQDSDEAMTSEFLRLGLMGAGTGLVIGIALHALAGHEGPPTSTVLFIVVCGVLLPALRWLRFRREAARLRATIGRRLPRLLTGARVLLESGAVTPQQALTTVVSVYSDPAADVLREAMRDREVRRVELQASLDHVARTCRLEPLQRLADGLRVGTRFGSGMAELLSEYAADARLDWHTTYRERMVRAPVLMAVPALVFFVLPLLVVILLLVISPLVNGLGRL